MFTPKFHSFKEAEAFLLHEVTQNTDFWTTDTVEKFGVSFELTDPTENKNDRSNYLYAQAFYEWLLTGSRNLPSVLLSSNPSIARFTDPAGLPDNFSTTYGWKIKEQLPAVIRELLRNPDSRRAYLNINLPMDKVVLDTETTHEFPCTIGLHFFTRMANPQERRLYLMVNMRSNNILSVLPYDVYNFTRLQIDLAAELNIAVGSYIHQINSAHVFKSDLSKVDAILAKSEEIFKNY